MRRHTIQPVLIALVLALVVPSASPAPAPASGSAPLIVIDAGHGGPYSNANANGLREETVNLQIALELRRQLRARGYRVAMTRTTDRAVMLSDIATWKWSPGNSWWYHRRDGHRGLWSGIPRDDLQARCNLANRLGADLFISIHNNGSASRAARGTEVIASGKDPLGIGLSRIVQRRVVARTGLRDRGVKQMDLYVCRWSNAPAILVEGAFITNPGDAYRLKKSWFRRRIAVGIAEGVKTWFASDPYDRLYPRIAADSASLAAVTASRSDFPTGAPVAVVVRRDRWADAPGAPVLAATLGGPLLWSDPSGVSTDTAAELTRLAPQRLYVLGLDGSFDDTAGASITMALPSGSEVDTVTAETRSALSVEIAERMSDVGSGDVMVVDESDTPGALVAASAAAKTRTPLLLSTRGVLGDDAREYLSENAPTRAVLLGPAAAVPSSIVPGAVPVRVDGVDYAARANAVNARYYRASARGSLRPVIADFRYGAEYLTAAGYAARRGQPLAPVKGRVLPTYTRYWIVNRRPQIAGFQMFDARRTMPGLTEQMLRKADRE